MTGVYVEAEADQEGVCLVDNFSQFCKISQRNQPFSNWNPRIVVWPTTARQVQVAVRFARKHNLCVAVAGTGHDMLNRHSINNNGLWIRTSFLKEIDVDVDDEKRGFGHAEGNVLLGAGVVFDEALFALKDHNKMMPTGWCSTVGVVGWHLGGGHGPLAPNKGLGADQILAVEMVLANGDLVYVDEENHPDLFFALRGGGGSTWGVVTALYTKLYDMPALGLTKTEAYWMGDMCSYDSLHKIMTEYNNWHATLDGNWSITFAMFPGAQTESCGMSWTVWLFSMYSGGQTEQQYIDTWHTMHHVADEVLLISYANTEDNAFALITPYNPAFSINPAAVSVAEGKLGGLPSIMVQRSEYDNGNLNAHVTQMLERCRDGVSCDLFFSTSFSGQLGSPQLEGTSLSNGMRSGLAMISFGENNGDVDTWYSLGANSYFSESAYTMENWQERYWGDNYARLLEVKQEYDPKNFFWCRHCVGSEGVRTPKYSYHSHTHSHSHSHGH